MALDGSVTLVQQIDVGDREKLLVDLVGPSSYANGGEAVTPDFFPFRTGGIVIEDVQGWVNDGETGQVQFDAAGQTLKFLTPAGAEEANTTDLSGNTYRLEVVGR